MLQEFEASLRNRLHDVLLLIDLYLSENSRSEKIVWRKTCARPGEDQRSLVNVCFIYDALMSPMRNISAPTGTESKPNIMASNPVTVLGPQGPAPGTKAKTTASSPHPIVRRPFFQS